MQNSVAPPWVLAAFTGGVLVLLALDLGLFHRKAHAVRPKEALGWVAVWVSLSLLFNAWVYWKYGPQKGIEFLTGYLLEESLSVDNLFVFIVIFSYFAVPKELEHRVLFWGILGALVMRAAFIVAGTALLSAFGWFEFVFAAVLIVSAVKLLRSGEDPVDPERNPVLKLFRKFVPLASGYRGARFWVREQGKLQATPLLMVLVVVEATDVVFAVDSIPAVLGVTRDPFIVYTSNICAILGLRAIYFLLSGLLVELAYLNVGLGLLLGFIGVKMAIGRWVHIPTAVSLGAVAVLIGGAAAASLLFPPADKKE